MRYRHSSYYSSRYRHRRMTFGEVIRIILLILIVGMIGFGTFMVYRAVHAEVILADLKKQNEVLSQTVARYQAVMPDPALTGAAEPLPYQTLYPEMRVAQTPEVATAKRGTVFLTFEGGPLRSVAIECYAKKLSDSEVDKDIVALIADSDVDSSLRVLAVALLHHHFDAQEEAHISALLSAADSENDDLAYNAMKAVSYTHLTLPTIYSV